MGNSVESKISRNLYALNKENLTKDIQLHKLKSSKISISNFKRLLSYLFSGGLVTILKKAKQKKNGCKKEDFVLKDYVSYPNVKVAVYTSIFGGYDQLLEPFFTNDDIDYFVLTDSDVPEESAWKRISLPFNGDTKMSSTEKNRFCKMLPHLFLQNYDYSIYIDGNIRIVTDLMPLICDLKDKVIGIHDYQTNCIYKMKDSIILGKRANKKNVMDQIKKYKIEGFPKEFGAFECNVIVRKHNDKKCISLMEQWWDEFSNTKSKRDQLSLPYVLWKNKLTKDFICSLGYHVRENPRFIVYPKHNDIKK